MAIRLRPLTNEERTQGRRVTRSCAASVRLAGKHATSTDGPGGDGMPAAVGARQRAARRRPNRGGPQPGRLARWGTQAGGAPGRRVSTAASEHTGDGPGWCATGTAPLACASSTSATTWATKSPSDPIGWAASVVGRSWTLFPCHAFRFTSAHTTRLRVMETSLEHDSPAHTRHGVSARPTGRRHRVRLCPLALPLILPRTQKPVNRSVRQFSVTVRTTWSGTPSAPRPRPPTSPALARPIFMRLTSSA